MGIVGSTDVLLAEPLLPAVRFVVRVADTASDSGREEVAETTVVPVVAEVITSVRLPLAPPPGELHAGESTNLPGPLVILAVAEPLPNVVPTAVTVMVSV